MEEKKKHKKVTFKQIKKSEDDIHVVDSATYYVKSETDPEREPYFVYNSINIGWTCDCMDFTMKMRDDGKNPYCKHIKKVIERISK
ncbi:MAG TPA: hypothetical protein VL854_12360 [Nitrososphaeraceae archaeon]|nr:hypothetical protein [Nitrososphaeraceae archaeon]